MRLRIKKITKSGKDEYEWIQNVESVIIFDDVKAKIEVCADCCVRVPVIKNGDVYKHVKKEIDNNTETN